MNRISIYRGDDEERLLIFKNGTTKERIDITGWKIYFTVKKNKHDSDDVALIKVDWTDHSEPTEGETYLTLTDTDTDIDPDIYICDIQIKRPAGTIKTIDVMDFEIHTDITRRTT